MNEYQNARTWMIEGQLRPNRITDPAILAAFSAVEREKFVAPTLRGAAYVDGSISVGGGRYMIEPVIVARMMQEARIGKADRVLDIGCATGYSAVIAAHLAGQVVATESDPNLLKLARLNIAGLPNVTLVNSSGSTGHPDGGPYDVILVEGAVGAVPDSLTAQLADKGRLLCATLSVAGKTGELVLMERVGDAISSRPICDAWLKPLPGSARDAEFVL